MNFNKNKGVVVQFCHFLIKFGNNMTQKQEKCFAFALELELGTLGSVDRYLKYIGLIVYQT